MSCEILYTSVGTKFGIALCGLRHFNKCETSLMVMGDGWVVALAVECVVSVEAEEAVVVVMLKLGMYDVGNPLNFIVLDHSPCCPGERCQGAVVLLDCGKGGVRDAEVANGFA
eukprot:3461688-Amphidinium_carterae.2